MTDRRHIAGDPRDEISERGKRGLRGAMNAIGLYVGPILSKAAGASATTLSHAVGGASQHEGASGGAGGVEDSTSYRAKDTFDSDSAGSGATTSSVRPSGHTMFRGDGVQGGSTPGKPFDTTGRAQDGTTPATKAFGRYNYTNFDGRDASTVAGPGALGQAGRGTNYVGGGTDDVTTRIPVPTVQAGANPAAGVVSVSSSGAGKVTLDLHADDITGGANGRNGCEVVVYARDSFDTDEDALTGPAGKADFDSTTQADAITGLTAGTYAVYVRFLAPSKAPRHDTSSLGTTAKGACGPFSARSTLVVA